MNNLEWITKVVITLTFLLFVLCIYLFGFDFALIFMKSLGKGIYGE